MEPNPNCPYCFGNGHRHNGYYKYPCTCLRNYDALELKFFGANEQGEDDEQM